MTVSKETIVKASIDILNRDGVEGLSMRTIAKELGIKAASLYWHFNGKQELFGAISESLCWRIEIPEESGSPKDYLTEIFNAYRTLLLSVRDSVQVMENSRPNTQRRLEIIRAISTAFMRMGVPIEKLMTISNLFNNYVLSFVADECRFKNVSPKELSELEKILSPYDKSLLRVSDDFDGQFLYGLQVLFAGLEAVGNE
jgi:AcrR family transcriptional regulator